MQSYKKKMYLCIETEIIDTSRTILGKLAVKLA